MEEDDKPKDCTHPEHVRCRRVVAKGYVHFVKQCLTCGDSLGSIAKNSVPESERDGLPEWNEEIRKAWDTEHTRQWRLYRERKDAEFESRRSDLRIQHAEYLDTPQWQDRRTRRLQLDNYRCQAQLPGCAQRATEVHHLSYRFHGNEPLFDLVSVCRGCHEAISAMEGRITSIAS